MTCKHVNWIPMLLILSLSLCGCSCKMLSVQSIPDRADKGKPPVCYQAATGGFPTMHFCTKTQTYICELSSVHTLDCLNLN